MVKHSARQMDLRKRLDFEMEKMKDWRKDWWKVKHSDLRMDWRSVKLTD